jgi:ribosome-associated protein
MPTLLVNTDHITLVQAVKMAGLTPSGGQAKRLIREGHVSVNDVRETQPGRKLLVGDRLWVQDGDEWTVGRQ